MPAVVHAARFSSRLAAAMHARHGGRVMIASAAAAYASLQDGTVVALVRRDADPPPTAVIVPQVPDMSQLAPHAAALTLSPGGLVVGGAEITAADWWSPRQVVQARPDGDAAALLRRLRRSTPQSDFEAELTNTVVRRIDEAAARWALGDGAGSRTSLLSILGLGPGSTPAGDDAIAGFLIGLRAFDRHAFDGSDRLDDVASDIAGTARTRTTTVSAGLLREAADGYCAPSLGRAVDALAADFAGSALQRERLLAGLLAVGHTSGSATAAGLLAAIRCAGTHASTHSPHTVRTSWAPLT
ncbi:oxamate carbamoyltransferase subunit AllH family protein [Spelaeicoccus albus]|nr:DUF2877 domain-containing protein [Spelaeicoccus albus]